MEHESEGNTNRNGGSKGLIKGLDDLEKVETIQITWLLRSSRILRRVLETWEIYCRSNSSDKPSAYVGEKNSQMSKKMIIIISK